jgi:hypothetical protein
MNETLNSSFLASTYSDALEGIYGLSQTTLSAGLPLYRFGNTTRKEASLTGPWWLGFSPFEGVVAYAKARNEPLSLVARECLAIDWDWSKVDLLVRVLVKQGLSAWSGTPKTQFIRPEGEAPNRRWEPDRRITQLYIPGLGQPSPTNPARTISEEAFTVLSFEVIPTSLPR